LLYFSNRRAIKYATQGSTSNADIDGRHSRSVNVGHVSWV